MQSRRLPPFLALLFIAFFFFSLVHTMHMGYLNSHFPQTMVTKYEVQKYNTYLKYIHVQRSCTMLSTMIQNNVMLRIKKKIFSSLFKSLCLQVFMISALAAWLTLHSPRMGPPPFQERVPHRHSPTSENGRKEV